MLVLGRVLAFLEEADGSLKAFATSISLSVNQIIRESYV
jgi:hypothetical protein